MSECTALVVRDDQQGDPVIRAKRRKLEAIERMACRFKRIDIEFLQMTKPSGDYPMFAILPFHLYRRKSTCTWNGSLPFFQWFEGSGSSSMGHAGPRNCTTSCTATPSKEVPASIVATVEEVRRDFDEIYVAWDADWEDVKGDPLVIGDIDGVFFLLGKWDTTSVESYIAG